MLFYTDCKAVAGSVVREGELLIEPSLRSSSFVLFFLLFRVRSARPPVSQSVRPAAKAARQPVELEYLPLNCPPTVRHFNPREMQMSENLFKILSFSKDSLVCVSVSQ